MKVAAWWRCALAVVAFAATVAVGARARGDAEPGPGADEPWEIEVAPGAQVILDEYLREATPAEAAEGLRFCESVPGCHALWQPGVGTAVILQPVDIDGEPPPITVPSSE